MQTLYETAVDTVLAMNSPAHCRSAVCKVITHPDYTPNPIVRLLLRLMAPVGQAPVPLDWPERVLSLLTGSSHEKVRFLSLLQQALSLQRLRARKWTMARRPRSRGQTPRI